MALPDVLHLRSLLEIVTHKGISGASRATGIPKATLSRHLSLLEGRVGSPIFDRRQPSFALTEAGKVVHHHAANVLRELTAMMTAAGSTEASGLLRISTTFSLFMYALKPHLPEFLERYPKIDLYVEAASAHRDLRDGAFDLSLRGGQLSGDDLIARRLGQVSVSRYVLAGRESSREGSRLLAALSPNGAAAARPRPRLALNDPLMVKAMVLSGYGSAWLPDYTCREEEQNGQLTRIAGSLGATQLEVFILYRRTEALPFKARAFIDFLAERVAIQS